ncbi:kinesin-like protein KIN-12F isoform X1 [Olea europaea var. sylvestris]|uniref:kinesin-like protein KIN-12F isoform X1 n=1 Tax=Olea europaea var. sylvestris TaxID=158386 RepID=UPI000C1D0826|nr:kinesin-like protein KIN-12F isoform X1 [Olea europaea var. sylvestris]
MKCNSEVSENRFLGSISASVSPFKNLFSKSKQKMNSNHRSRPKFNSENIAPVNPNIQISDPSLSSSIPFPKKSYATKVNPYTEEFTSSAVQQKLPSGPDTAVKVVLRIRPANGFGNGDGIVKKVSEDSVSVGDITYTFDSVLDSKSSQEDVYQLVGTRLVKDALAGYNTSVLAYGQTGSGKTYTMWGPPSAMVEDGPSVSGLQGVVPRIFRSLFSEIQKEQDNSDGKQINYQCRCSFLEVHNEKIRDLLDPTQRNLEIKYDEKIGFYVENLTEEYVTSYEDVTQILIKGLSNRKVGATSINSKSSRSHIIFTCIIESWCKESSSKCFGSSKTSRISFVDLAGFERNVLDGATKEHVKEEKYIKKSMSQLGHLVNIKAEISHDGKSEDVSFRSSSLTHLLGESFGGNAKLSIICAIAPDNKCSGETLRTLRFAQRAKLMKNEPIVNLIAEDDVNDLTDQIRQLKEQLIRAKFSSCNSFRSNIGHSKGRSARESLNQLRLSLNRSLILPRIDNGCKEELCINEEDVKELGLQIDNLSSPENGECSQLYSAEGSEADLTCEHYLSCSEESENEELNSRVAQRELLRSDNNVSVADPDNLSKKSMAINSPSRRSLSISGSNKLAVLEDPVLSESPKISNSQRRSMIFSSNHLPKQDDVIESSKNLEVLQQSHQQCDQNNSSLKSSRMFPGTTEPLAASLHRGLQIIDCHKKNSASTRSSVSFSFKHLALNSCPSTNKENASVQTLPEDEQSSGAPSGLFVCMKCKRGGITAAKEVEDGLKTWMVRVDKSEILNGVATQITKDTNNDLALALKRERELDSICKKQAAKIEHLNQLLEQYKCKNDQDGGCCNSSILTDMKDQLPPIYEHENEICHSLNSHDKLLAWDNDKNHGPEFIKEKCEIKEVHEDIDPCMKKSFDVKEREAFLKEIEILRSQLKSCTEPPTNKSTNGFRSSLLLQSIQLRRSSTYAQGNNEEEFEKERERWMEMESEWISLTDELRIDLESIRQRAENAEMELRLEKKCTEELDDVLKRSVLGQARMVEHYAELQEKYDDLVGKHRAIMVGIAEVKRAAKKAGAKGHGSRFAKSLVAELSTLRVKRERERELLKKENRSLKIQLKDTAEAVHAAGELLVRLREVEEAASVAEEKNSAILEENDNLKKQIEKLKRKHKMEMNTMKQYLAESRLPEAALRPLCREDSDIMHHDTTTLQHDDDQAWRAEFGAIYQEHY